MSRRPIVAGNWKMNASGPRAAVEIAAAVVRELNDVTAVECAVCPPFTALMAVAEVVRHSRIGLGAQNMYPEEKGAFTGEVDPNALLEIGCKYVIIGHSERRAVFEETDEFINRKVKKALEKGLTPIMCCGETLDEREEGITLDIVRGHIDNGLADLRAADVRKVVIAYEPVWAIGTGRTAEPEDAQEVHAFIRHLLSEKYGRDTADTVRIQYGGSVKPENAKELFDQPDIDGGLIGGASLKADTFRDIVLAAR